MTPVSDNGTQLTKETHVQEGWVDAGMRGNCRVFVRAVQSGAKDVHSNVYQRFWSYGRWVMYAFFLLAWLGIVDRTVRIHAFPDWARDALYGRSEDPRRALIAQWAYRTVLYAPVIILSYYAHRWWLTNRRIMNIGIVPPLFLLSPPRPVHLRSFWVRRGGQFLARWAVLTATIYFLALICIALPLHWIGIELVDYFEQHPLRFVLMSPAIASVLLVLIEQSQHWMEADEERTLELAQRGIIVQANVAAMQEEKEWDGEESNVYYRLQYVVNGASPQKTMDVNMLEEQWRLLKVGDNVALIYLPDRPDHAQIAAEVARWVR
jgi:hypothetical protein